MADGRCCAKVFMVAGYTVDSELLEFLSGFKDVNAGCRSQEAKGLSQDQLDLEKSRSIIPRIQNPA
jgi:hypothetical protein